VRTWRWGARTSTSTPARAAPAFLYVRRDLQEALRQPIWGWFGRRDQFAMAAGYDPAESIDRYLVGTPPVLGGYAVIEGARITAEAGIDALAANGQRLTEYTIQLAQEWLGPRLAPLYTRFVDV
jgi:kynureninase